MRVVVLRGRHLLLLAGVVSLVATAATAILSLGLGLAPAPRSSAVSPSAPAAGANVALLNRLTPIYEVARPDMKLSLTVNAAAGTRSLGQILAVLGQQGVRATFFLTGAWMEEHPTLVREIHQAGHEIGNHTFAHPHLGVLGDADLFYEIATTDAIIKELTGERSRVFRPPFGEYDARLMRSAYQLGYHVVMWSTNTYDWRDPETTFIVRRIEEGARPGAIVLLNANGKNTADALAAAIPSLKRRGFEFVPVGELVYYEDFIVEPNSGVQRPVPERPAPARPGP